MHDDYEIPQTTQEADERIVILQNDIHEICSQLSDKNKTDEQGRRVSYHDYHDWRKRAVYAMEAKKRELRLLKLWRKRAHEQKAKKTFDENDPGDLLYDAYNLIKQVFRDYGEDDIKPGEQERMDKYRDWLRGAGYRA